MRILACTLLALVFIQAKATAQQAGTKQYKVPLAAKVTLRDVEDKYSAEIFSLEMPEPDAMAEQKILQAVKEQISIKYPRKEQSLQKRTTTSSVPPPTVAIGFVADSASGIPPDNCSAVSKGNKAVAVMNSTISIHDATTGSYISRKGLYNFTLSLGLSGTNNYRYDPKVVYDPAADRFICVILNGTVQYNYVLLGFSQTNDPNGAWNFYKLYGDFAGDTTWFDYPAISVTQNEFFLTGNKIMYDSTWQAGFTQTLIYQFRKLNGYNGDTLVYHIWDNVAYGGKPLRCLYPLNPGDSLLGPSQYFLSNRNFDVANDSVFLVQVSDTVGSSSASLTVTPIAGGISYGAPPDGRQPDTSKSLATNDGRVLGGFIKGNEIQFVSTSVNPSNGNSAVYHGVISNFNTAPSLTGRIFSVDTLDLGYPNISYTGTVYGSNQSILSFNYSGPGAYPGFGAIFFDGSNYSDMLNITSGTGTVNMLAQKEQRWGDYSGSQPDWNAVGAVWVYGIFGKSNHTYGDYMAKLASPYKEGISQPIAAPTPSKVYPNPALEFVRFGFHVATEQGFSFVIYDVNGRVVDKLMDQLCHDGDNVIQFNIASLTPGTYFLRAIGNKGEKIEVHSFVRQ